MHEATIKQPQGMYRSEMLIRVNMLGPDLSNGSESNSEKDFTEESMVDDLLGVLPHIDKNGS